MLYQFKKNWRYLFVTPLFFSALCTAFIKHNGINILNPEALLSYFLLVLLGVLPGVLMVFGGTLLRLITISGVLILFLLTQIKVLPILPLGLKYRYIAPLFLIGLTTILYFIREKLDKLLLLMFTVFWIGAFFTVKTPLISVQKFQTLQNKEGSELPPYIEIVLDEQIGIQGGSILDKKTHYFSNDLVNAYINKGFTVYGQAYSRDFQTLSSFASFLNFKPIGELDNYINTTDGKNAITQNKLFEVLSSQGYAINVFQSTFVDLCEYREKINLKKCSTYNYAAPIPYPIVKVKEKSLDIIDNIFSVVPLFDKFNHKLFSLVFPNNKKQTIIEASTATYRTFPDVLNLAKEVEKGNAYFIHLLMPHYPYVFDSNCEYLGDRGKSVATYLEQVKCTHKMVNEFLRILAQNPEAQNSTIVIHGDHGLRIPKPTMKKSYSFTAENLIRTYSTFFAVKSRLEDANYSNIQLPIDYLLMNIATRQKISSYEDENQFVYLRSDKHTDRPFDRGTSVIPQLIG
ncbi:Sulfatase [Legionella gratiana]|uniref:Phosphoglycerol transferase and related proteins, alkaline phosphatase superfamily n=1 Tax=Legionella gratiana TaxID=45066 RepID=A0A378J9F3_9GAMM|nr:sulfatase-like hydrolase/transferase [Legionella gratiana]KTD11591.1 Sulfatase [Legionella gratiana]STX41200.1 Phosphoglycerol transferase and related proteins, alkaline phosphatase superfamily [Legionella gratiana]